MAFRRKTVFLEDTELDLGKKRRTRVSEGKTNSLDVILSEFGTFEGCDKRLL